MDFVSFVSFCSMLGVLVGVWMGTLEKQLNKWDFCGKLLGFGTFWGFEGRSGVPFPSMHHQNDHYASSGETFPTKLPEARKSYCSQTY